MTTADTVGATSANHDLVIRRVFDAPLERVWSAWTDPDQLVQWFFPAGFVPKDPHFDVRPSGSYRYTFVSNDGTPHRLRGTFEEITDRERLVFTHGWANQDGIVERDTRVTVTFAEVEDRTHVTVRQVGLATEESRVSHARGWGESLDHLAALVA